MFGPSMDHLDQLIKIPYGCGEQNMVRFAPAVFAAKYLKVTNRYSDAMKERVEYIMETGLQKIILFSIGILLLKLSTIKLIDANNLKNMYTHEIFTFLT
jgi:hypothetical protein